MTPARARKRANLYQSFCLSVLLFNVVTKVVIDVVAEVSVQLASKRVDQGCNLAQSWFTR
ncbi:MAG: hypothetical protein JNJ83_10675 [Verrucomicrobiaceae bacterium]|nr:hypothetical protein [Verrucomicrobiaceae bacterium]